MSTIRAAIVQLWSTPDRSAGDNRRHCLEMAEVAAASHPDIVVLPEAIAMLCMPDDKPDFTYRDVCESIPGETSDALAAIARKHETNLVCGLIEDKGTLCQNVAVVYDRKGSLIGKYEKLHEPEVCRLQQAAATGETVPVFDLDFGRIGIMICWDLNSPEIASILAMKGADLILFPHLIGLPVSNNFSIRLRARAIDSGLPILAAGMRDNSSHTGHQDGLHPTCAISGSGDIIAQSERSGSDIVYVDVDISSSLESRQNAMKFSKDRRPDVYSSEYGRIDHG